MGEAGTQCSFPLAAGLLVGGVGGVWSRVPVNFIAGLLIRRKNVR